MIAIDIDEETCIKCGKYVRVCPEYYQLNIWGYNGKADCFIP